MCLRYGMLNRPCNRATRQQTDIVGSVRLLLFDGTDDVDLNNKPVPKMEIIPSEKAQPRLKHYTTRLSRCRSP